MRNRLAVALLALPLLAGATACGGSSDGAGKGGQTGTLTVLAAASLTESFDELAKQFESDHPGTRVKLSFDSSATLAEQVNQGAPADVLATADEKTMQTVVDAGGASDPAVFATNRLTMVVPAKNPAHLRSFTDLDKPGVAYVVCVPTAPCGALAQTQLAAHHVTAKPKSEEVDVKSVLAKVEADEADAGLVYVTDAVAAGDKVKQIDIPASGDTLNRYPIAALKDAAQPTLAREWVHLVTSAQGQQVLHAAGFGKP
jgi:molybdate transport system substrate-binding protein